MAEEYHTTHPSRHQVGTSHGEYYNLGSFKRPIRTPNSDAQLWFDRGLIWSYGFNHQAACNCFEKVIALDANCPMGYWGLAYALGPNYNKPWEVFDQEDLRTTLLKASNAAATAAEKAESANHADRLLIEAIQYRYPRDTSSLNASGWNEDYANAMQKAYNQYPDDLDVVALYADALMNLTPWALWDIATGKPARDARTLQVKSILDTALSSESGRQHPGILHLYIHLMEMSGTPEAAMPAADCLRGLVPDSGHLNHMPTHLDVLCGDYSQAIKWNSEAILADEKYLAEAGPVNFYTLYRCHNYHFRIYAAMLAGSSAVAIDTVDRLEKSLPTDLLRVESPPMADWLEGFMSIRIHVYIRFGLWREILDIQLPDDRALFCVTSAMAYYARCVALSATGNVHDAREARTMFLEAVKHVPKSRTLFNNTCTDILAVAAEMLEGELLYREGEVDSAFQHLRQAIHLEDNLPYDEPWGWMQPTRHALGALLLEQGQVEEALRIYEADLGLNDALPRALQHPNNVWALHGYHECFVRLGRQTDAQSIEKLLQKAKAAADIPVESSCYCRQEIHGAR